MFRLLILIALIAVAVMLALVLLRGARQESSKRALLESRVREVANLAYLHDELSPALAGAIIARTRGINDDTSIPELQRALDDVLDLARAHRAEEPDLAVIFIDTVRSNELT